MKTSILRTANAIAAPLRAVFPFRLRVPLAIAALALCAGRPVDVQAQATRADSAAVLLEAASRFERAGEQSVAEALYQMVLDRFGDTPAAAAVRSLASRAPGDRSTRSGRVELQVWSTLYGLWLGVAVPAAFGADGPEAYGVGLLVGGPVGFLSGFGLARSRQLSDGQARAITFGGTWGTWQGFGWAEVLDLGENESCELDVCFSDGGVEERFAGMIAGGLAGIGTGILLAKKPISPGVATTVNFGALWGTWFGIAAGILADQEDDALLATVLIGGDAGLVTTALLAPGWNISRNRARLISIAGVVGGLAGAGIDLIAQPDDEKAAVAIPLAGSIVGLTIGALTTRRFDATGGGDGGAGPGLNALIERTDDGLRFGSPLPMLTVGRFRANGRRRSEARATMTLFSARF